MSHKIIMITGATDGIGLETAKLLAPKGHNLILHGRSADKLSKSQAEISELGSGQIKTVQADLSHTDNVRKLADELKAELSSLDVLINNAGVYKTSQPRTSEGYDLRFMVNLFAPVIFTESLLPLMPKSGRVVNLSSAAQAPVNINGLKGSEGMGDMPAYAQSKLALTMWTKYMADRYPYGPSFYAINPGSLLNTNMVKLGWGGSNNSVSIGAEILVKAALDESFEGRSGEYFDNDSGHFAPPHPEGLDAAKIKAVIDATHDITQK